MKKFIQIAFVAAFAAIAGYGVYTNQKAEPMSDLMLANVEALADGESGSSDCDTYCKTDYRYTCFISWPNAEGITCPGYRAK